MKCPALGTSATVGRHPCYVAIRQTSWPSCRAAHNAYAAVSFNSYGGTVTRTPLEAVNRLGWILATLRSPVRFTSVAPRTVTEFVSCSFRDALALMRTHDFPQLPHHHDALGWILVT